MPDCGFRTLNGELFRSHMGGHGRAAAMKERREQEEEAERSKRARKEEEEQEEQQEEEEKDLDDDELELELGVKLVVVGAQEEEAVEEELQGEGEGEKDDEDENAGDDGVPQQEFKVLGEGPSVASAQASIDEYLSAGSHRKAATRFAVDREKSFKLVTAMHILKTSHADADLLRSLILPMFGVAEVNMPNTIDTCLSHLDKTIRLFYGLNQRVRGRPKGPYEDLFETCTDQFPGDESLSVDTVRFRSRMMFRTFMESYYWAPGCFRVANGHSLFKADYNSDNKDKILVGLPLAHAPLTEMCADLVRENFCGSDAETVFKAFARSRKHILGVFPAPWQAGEDGVAALKNGSVNPNLAHAAFLEPHVQDNHKGFMCMGMFQFMKRLKWGPKGQNRCSREVKQWSTKTTQESYYKVSLEWIETFEDCLLTDTIPGLRESEKTATGCDLCYHPWSEGAGRCIDPQCGGQPTQLPVLWAVFVILFSILGDMAGIAKTGGKGADACTHCLVPFDRLGEYNIPPCTDRASVSGPGGPVHALYARLSLLMDEDVSKQRDQNIRSILRELDSTYHLGDSDNPCMVRLCFRGWKGDHPLRSPWERHEPSSPG